MAKLTHLNTNDAARLLVQLGGPVLQGLLYWINDNLNRYERLTVSQWIDDWWYVEVKDTRIEEHPANWLLGFTVHVKDDVIMWCNHTKYNVYGGNCFCRSERWMRLMRKQFQGLTVARTGPRGVLHSAQVYDYRELRTSKPKQGVTFVY